MRDGRKVQKVILYESVFIFQCYRTFKNEQKTISCFCFYDDSYLSYLEMITLSSYII